MERTLEGYTHARDTVEFTFTGGKVKVNLEGNMNASGEVVLPKLPHSSEASYTPCGVMTPIGRCRSYTNTILNLTTKTMVRRCGDSHTVEKAIIVDRTTYSKSAKSDFDGFGYDLGIVVVKSTTGIIVYLKMTLCVQYCGYMGGGSYAHGTYVYNHPLAGNVTVTE